MHLRSEPELKIEKDGMIGVKLGLNPEAGSVPPSGRTTNTTNNNNNRIQCNGSSRQRAQQAVEYYNTNVIRARGSTRSYNDRYNGQISPPSRNLARQMSPQDALYRSNSSLELMHDQYHNNESTLKREYGSHGSIDVIGYGTPGTGDSFFAMLQDYRPVVLTADQRSPGPAEYLRHKLEPPPTSDNAVNSLTDETDGGRSQGNTSPKLKLKLHKFWGKETKTTARNGNTEEKMDNNSSSLTNGSTAAGNSDLDERQRRRVFAHYDVQSLTANLGYAAKLRGLLLARRRNTTTGASAASMLATRSSTPDGDSSDEDGGDGRTNDLIESCPYFRNEIGGEEERNVSLTRLCNMSSREQTKPFHRPALAGGVSVLEFPKGETHWKHGTCPYQSHVNTIENIDYGALYYRKYFYGQDHQNWFGMDDTLGPVAVSIKREKVERTRTNSNDNSSNNQMYQYRLIIRTSELLTLRGTVLEDSIPNLKPSSNIKTYNTKEVLEYIAPEITLSCLRLGAPTQTEDQLLKLDEQGLSSNYKVGVMYCQAGQSSEEDMYNNEDAGPAFLEFLDTIGQRVRLKGFDKYRAGLDNKSDSTGLYSVYSHHQNCEIMFHVSTMLPFTPNNRQQLLRKRHIGNDIVTIVFQEPDAQPFTPKNIRSQFQHVFIIVRAINPCTDNTQYRVAVTRSKEVPTFGPPIHEGATFPKGKAFADFLSSKVVNAEIAAHRSEKFSTMATRTRQEYLKDLTANHSTTTLLESGQKFSMLSFSSKKKERGVRPRFLPPDSTLRGSLCWQVTLEDSSQSQLVDCYLGISTDSFVLVEERTREVVMVSPCKSMLGWFIHSNSLCIYHHQGECTMIHMKENGDRDELMEVLVRLRSVTPGCLAQELSLKRNSMGQLGFHVQPDGLVTQVESKGLAYSAGLRQGSRLVEICKVAVSTLTHDQMVDLLKTSVSVTVTVIPPLPDGSPRKGCTLQNCKYALANYEADYENLSCPEDNNPKNNRKPASLQQAGNHRRKYERSFSPPRSSNSSGYGTGSSSRSFNDNDPRFHQQGVSSNEDRWYEDSVPPLPARLQQVQAVKDERCGVLSMAKKWENMENGVDKTTVIGRKKYEDYTHYLEEKNTKMRKQQQQQQQRWNGSEEDVLTTTHNRQHQFSSPGVRYMNNDVGDKSHTQRSIDYLITKMPKISQTETISLPPEVIRSDTDSSSVTSDRLYGGAAPTGGCGGGGGAPSEDELSAGSCNVSPRLRRAKPASTASSRNHSPRLLTKDTGEARLRPGVTTRVNNSNRNSANLASSTLQEDLIKLINPDYSSERDEGKAESLAAKMSSNGSVSSGSSHTVTPVLDNSNSVTVRSRSRENINLATALSVLPVDDKKLAENHGSGTNSASAEVILTMARPATVISNASTASSPAPSEAKLARDERLSPRVTKSQQQQQQQHQQQRSSPKGQTTPEDPMLPIPVPDPGEMDWSSLVDTATRAMLTVKQDDSNSIPEAARNGESLGHWVDDVAERLGLDPGGSSGARRVTDLQNHVTQLETRVARETRRRVMLEEEVRRLRDENRRLQEESQAAAQQLRRFTEWFFQTIDRQG